MLSQEIERLNSLIKGHRSEIEEWRGRYSKLEITINEYKSLEYRIT
jgi:chromosome segregation ATPase